jgi:hypothetical protein
MAIVKGVPFSKLPRAKQHAIFGTQRKQRATPAENLFCSYLAWRDCRVVNVTA